MKNPLLAMAALVLSAGGAFAADLPARTYTKAPVLMPAVYDWAGFYIGLNGGGGFSHNCWTNTSTFGVPTVPTASEGCHDASGGLVGGQIGYRWQSANWVFGFEGQGDWANFKGSNGTLPSAPVVGITNRTKIDAVGLLTGQVGYAWDNVLWYVKGGAAATHNIFSGFITATGAPLDSADQTRWGGAVGTGVEIGFAPNWTVGVEYDHLFMGTDTLTLTTPAATVSRTESIKQDVDLGTVRLDYRFGGPVVAKY